MVCFALVACATRSSLAERPIEQAPSDVLRIPASRFDDPKLKSQVVDLRSGIRPDEAGAVTAYNFSAGWEFSALVPFLPKQTAARKNFCSVDLDVAWREWQIAVNPRTAVYRVLALDAQVVRAREAIKATRCRIDGHIIPAALAADRDFIEKFVRFFSDSSLT
jgi:hypothetical protein